MSVKTRNVVRNRKGEKNVGGEINLNNFDWTRRAWSKKRGTRVKYDNFGETDSGENGMGWGVCVCV